MLKKSHFDPQDFGEFEFSRTFSLLLLPIKKCRKIQIEIPEILKSAGNSNRNSPNSVAGITISYIYCTLEDWGWVRFIIGYVLICFWSWCSSLNSKAWVSERMWEFSGYKWNFATISFHDFHRKVFFLLLLLGSEFLLNSFLSFG